MISRAVHRPVARKLYKAFGSMLDGGIPRLNLLTLFDSSGVDSIGASGTDKVFWWGDSLALGGAEYLRNHYGNVINRGVGGETSDEVMARFTSPEARGTAIGWLGHNNTIEVSQVLSDVSGFVAGVTNGRYLVMGLLINAAHAIDPNDTKDAALSINTTLLETYGSRFLNILDYLKTQYDPEVPQDVIDVANGITPSSLRDGDIHLNAEGYALVAAKVMSTLIDVGLMPDPVADLSINGVLGNCLTVGVLNACTIRIDAPTGYPSISTLTKITNGGAGKLILDASGGLRRDVDGPVWNMQILLSDGSNIIFPLNEGGGATIYGYVEGDGAVYVGHLATTSTGAIDDLWTETQDYFHHAIEHGCGEVAIGDIGPEKMLPNDITFDLPTDWDLGADWAVVSGVATHTGTTGTFIKYLDVCPYGMTSRTAFEITAYGGSGLIGLSSKNGAYYPNAVGSYNKDTINTDAKLAIYCTSDGTSVDNISFREIYQATAIVPANPYNPGKDCAGNDLTLQSGMSSYATYAIPETAELLAADDGTFFLTGSALSKTLTELLALQGDQYFCTITKGLAIYDAVQVDPTLTKIDKYFGFI